ncbi:Aspartate/glutamate/uridylate kinase [Crassisporium funariophilum]|nr:Aspartate/glutamate/uridylate kinase [Crassisporium funariophilum]
MITNVQSTSRQKPGSRWIVHSFSGDCVKFSALRIAQNIIPRYLSHGFRIAIVCSACVGLDTETMSQQLLLRAASRVHRHRDGKLRSPRSNANVIKDSTTADLYRLEYSNLARRSVYDPVLLRSLLAEISEDCEWLTCFLSAAEKADTTSLRAQDVVLCLGERLTSKIMACVLQDQGFQVEVISAEDIQASPSTIDEREPCLDSFTAALAKRVEACYPNIPIVTGYFDSRDVPRPQKGGFAEPLSVLISIGLQAADLQIWTTANGILTLDPRRVSSARIAKSNPWENAVELTLHGHPCSESSVSAPGINSPSRKGISVSSQCHQRDIGVSIQGLAAIQPLKLKSMKAQTAHGRPTTIVVKESAIMINVKSHTMNEPFKFLSDVIDVLKSHGAPMDIITTTPTCVDIAFEATQFSGKVEYLADDLGRHGTVHVQFAMAILTVVEDNTRKNAGMSGHVISTLTQGGVRVSMVGPGTGTNLSCVISAKDVTRAARLVRQTMFRKIDRLKV